MKMRKRQYRIGELAKALNVKKFVIRFWEKELGIKPDRSSGGQRFYEEKDFETFKTVKHLLYDQKFTIAGAKSKLKDLKKQPEKIMVIGSTKTESLKPEQTTPSQIHEKMFKLKEQLLKLHELL